MAAMTGRERMIKTLKGEKVDRAPIWLNHTFVKDEGRNEFIDSWMGTDPRMVALKEHYYNNFEVAKQIWAPGSSRILCTPAAHVHKVQETVCGNFKDLRYVINTPKGDLTYVDRLERNVSTVWRTEYPVKSLEDIQKLLSIDYKLGPLDYSEYYATERALGDRGMMITQVDTPAITISSMMPFEDYLLYTITEFDLIKELTAIAYERIKLILQKALEAGMGPVIRLMGCEQATPPMNGPEVYDELIVKYETPLIKMIHEAGRFAGVHCHGKVKTVLPKMVAMGVDLLDPVEGPPSGDIEFVEAKKLVDGRMTLAGNLQFDDLERKDASVIAQQVRSLFADGRKDHVYVSTAAFPLTPLSENLYRNMMVFLDEAVKCGTM